MIFKKTSFLFYHYVLSFFSLECLPVVDWGGMLLQSLLSLPISLPSALAPMTLGEWYGNLPSIAHHSLWCILPLLAPFYRVVSCLLHGSAPWSLVFLA